MKRLVNAFRGLRGRLTLSYVAVTVAALLALEVAALAAIFAVGWALGANQTQYVGDVIFTLGPQAADYYVNGAWDVDGLQTWIEEVAASGAASEPPQSVLDAPQAEISRDAPLLVLSERGTILAIAPESATDLVGRSYTPPAFDGAAAAVERAYNNDLSDVDVSTPSGDLFLAFPVWDETEQPIGALVLMIDPPSGYLLTVAPAIAQIVLVTGLILVIGVTPFGALFGFLTARGLTRRLQHLEEAADAWRRGEFEHGLPLQPMDEIGRLAERLRQMAESVQILMETRQALAAMEERNRLARELHDTVKQQSFAMMMQVRAVQNLVDTDLDAARDHLAEVEMLLKASQRELAMIIAELRPAALEDQGLAQALEGYLAEWSRLTVIETELAVDGNRTLALAVEQALYRITQEALANVARHSDASRVRLCLASRAGGVRLTITDNGRGFAVEKVDAGFGLTGMSQRVEALGGALHVESEPGAGTRIDIRIPLDEESTL